MAKPFDVPTNHGTIADIQWWTIIIILGPGHIQPPRGRVFTNSAYMASTGWKKCTQNPRLRANYCLLLLDRQEKKNFKISY